MANIPMAIDYLRFEWVKLGLELGQVNMPSFESRKNLIAEDLKI